MIPRKHVRGTAWEKHLLRVAAERVEHARGVRTVLESLARAASLVMLDTWLGEQKCLLRTPESGVYSSWGCAVCTNAMGR